MACTLLSRVAERGPLRCVRTSCYSCTRHMHSNGLVILRSINVPSVVTCVQRALAVCSDTVFIDLRQAPGCGTGIVDLIGTIYGCVAGISPCRNVIPLLSNQYPSGTLHHGFAGTLAT